MLFLYADTESPVFDNQEVNVSKVINCTEPTITIGWDEPNVTDNSGEYTISSSFKPGDRFPVDETTMVKYEATDSAGNAASLTFFVTVSGKIMLRGNYTPNQN